MSPDDPSPDPLHDDAVHDDSVRGNPVHANQPLSNPPLSNPLHGNPLVSRSDLARALLDLYEPLRNRHSPGGARVRLGSTGALFPEVAAELEGFARPLWGLIPYAVGGGAFDWTTHLRGLAAGTDPRHEEYWGPAVRRDQRCVEMAAIGLGLAALPGELWEPLDRSAKRDLADWLGTIRTADLPRNNWHFFRVLVDLGLERVGERHDPAQRAADLDELESYALGDGWYSDGPGPRVDHYVPFAMHLYGLLYAWLAGDQDPERAHRFRDRAATFAHDFRHWFADDGACLPFGRSLTYRFAMGSFWGGLAVADVDALPWGDTRELLLGHLRWWRDRPIADERGVLTIGFGYPNLIMSEPYNSPGSPYWAAKAFLPLAVGDHHPFWATGTSETSSRELSGEERSSGSVSRGARPADDPGLQVQAHPGMVVFRDRHGDVTALASGQSAPWLRHGAERYAKFAYSTRFAFSVPSGQRGLAQGAHDSMLALSDDGEHWRVRETVDEVELTADGVLRSVWRPFRDVEVETWLVASPPWHLRVHRIRSSRELWTAEAGFALDRAGDDPADPTVEREAGAGLACATSPAGASGLRDLDGRRDGSVLDIEPNTNLLAPRTVLPTLLARLEPGEHVLRCAVLASRDPSDLDGRWDDPPPPPQLPPEGR